MTADRTTADTRKRALARWRRLGLVKRFGLASPLVLFVNLLVLGWWVGEAIKVGVVHRTAAATSLYVENFIVTKLQELGDQDSISRAHVADIERLLATTPLGREIVAIKIWGPGGRVVYGTDAGEVFSVKEEQARAWRGQVVSAISSLEDTENVAQRAQYNRLIETYTPIRLEGSERVIAVAEFYATLDALNREIRNAQWRSWLLIAAVTLATYLLLIGLVRQGGNTITRQQRELRAKVVALNGLLDQNRALHERVRRAAERTTALNERFLRRVSAELHDGPAQDLSFALLKLDSVAAQLVSPLPALASPGQPSYDAVRRLVYVSDNSSKGRGVWRIAYNPSNRRLGTGTLINLGGNRATATALSADGTTLYVGYLKTNSITRILNPASSPYITTTWGQTGDGKGAASLTLAHDADGNPALYLAASVAVRLIDLSCAALPCVAQDTTITATTPLALASDGADTVFVADGAVGNLLLRYSVADDLLEILATQGTNAGTGTPERGFKFITAITAELDPTTGHASHVYVADDPSDGNQVLQGAAWDVVNP